MEDMAAAMVLPGDMAADIAVVGTEADMQYMPMADMVALMADADMVVMAEGRL